MSPRTPEQFEEMREEKKSLIMNTALEHFAREGYFSTTITHIARHAGISKGLMYNYFESKEALLSEIILKSITEVYSYFDIDKDGFLTEEEFVFFVKRVTQMFKEKKTFWRLYMQLMMQEEVRVMLSGSFPGNSADMQKHVSEISAMITDYFVRKKTIKGPGYDPYLDLNMFFIFLKGFAVNYIYTDNPDENYYEKTVDRIIELYK